MYEGIAEADRELVRRRAARLSALLDVEGPDAETLRRSAAAMRQDVLDAAALRQQTLGAAAMRQQAPDVASMAHGALRSYRAQRRSLATVWLRAAAVLLALAATLAVVPPARAWVLQRAHAVAQALGLAAPRSAAHTTPVREDLTAMDLRVTFPVRGETLDLAVDMQRLTLIVRHHDDRVASVEAAGTRDVRFVVTPDGLRVTGAAADAVLSLDVPRTVRRLRVHSADGRATFHDVPAARELRLEIGG
jgi:hypothetical protein